MSGVTDETYGAQRRSLVQTLERLDTEVSRLLSDATDRLAKYKVYANDTDNAVTRVRVKEQALRSLIDAVQLMDRLGVVCPDLETSSASEVSTLSLQADELELKLLISKDQATWSKVASKAPKTSVLSPRTTVRLAGCRFPDVADMLRARIRVLSDPSCIAQLYPGTTYQIGLKDGLFKTTATLPNMHEFPFGTPVEIEFRRSRLETYPPPHLGGGYTQASAMLSSGDAVFPFDQLAVVDTGYSGSIATTEEVMTALASSEAFEGKKMVTTTLANCRTIVETASPLKDGHPLLLDGSAIPSVINDRRVFVTQTDAHETLVGMRLVTQGILVMTPWNAAFFQNFPGICSDQEYHDALQFLNEELKARDSSRSRSRSSSVARSSGSSSSSSSGPSVPLGTSFASVAAVHDQHTSSSSSSSSLGFSAPYPLGSFASAAPEHVNPIDISHSAAQVQPLSSTSQTSSSLSNPLQFSSPRAPDSPISIPITKKRKAGDSEDDATFPSTSIDPSSTF